MPEEGKINRFARHRVREKGKKRESEREMKCVCQREREGERERKWRVRESEKERDRERERGRGRLRVRGTSFFVTDHLSRDRAAENQKIWKEINTFLEGKKMTVQKTRSSCQAF